MTRGTPGEPPITSGLRPDDLLADFESAAGLLVAVSGGPDSMALLALAAEWSNGASRPPVAAATFDHAFRDASRAEARMVSDYCARIDVPHAILDWPGARPASRIQESARDARYLALVAHAQAIGASHLLTAHHADDQAETILFRIIRGSGVAGLAGMKSARPRGPVIHARPLLHLRKADLVACCRSLGAPFVDDPSNRDPKFARTRMRALAAALAAEGLDAPTFARLAARASRADEALRHATVRLRTELAVETGDDVTRLDARPLAEAPAELVLRLLMDEIARIGRRPRLESAEPLVDLFRHRLAAGAAWRANLGGVLVDLGRDGRLTLRKEPSRRDRERAGAAALKTSLHDDT